MAAEKNFENRVKKFLDAEGCWYIKYWAGAAYTKSGIPDLLICCNGYFVAAEIKSSTGKLSDLQLWNLRKIRESGGIAIELYPEDFEKFKSLILGLKQRKGVTYDTVFTQSN